jgi:hypothetical protein
LSAFGKPPPPRLACVSTMPRLCFHHAIGVEPPHPLSVLVCRSRSFPKLRVAPRSTRPPPSPQESHRVIASSVSFCLGVVPLPRSISRANTLPLHRTAAHGCTRGHLPVDQPTDVCSMPRHSTQAGVARALRAMWAAMSAIHTLRYGPRRPRALCVWADRAGFGPWTMF